MRTRVTDMLGIDIPILAFSHCRDVVAAVTKAGGLGVLGAAGHSDKQLEIDLDWIEEQVGDLPYGVDLIVPAKYTGSDQGAQARASASGLVSCQRRPDSRTDASADAAAKSRARARPFFSFFVVDILFDLQDFHNFSKFETFNWAEPDVI